MHIYIMNNKANNQQMKQCITNREKKENKREEATTTKIKRVRHPKERRDERLSDKFTDIVCFLFNYFQLKVANDKLRQ